MSPVSMKRLWLFSYSIQARIVAAMTTIALVRADARKQNVAVTIELPFLICHFWFAFFDLPFLICHFWFAIFDLPFLICHFFDLPFLICHFWFCHFWFAIFDLPLLICHLTCNFWFAIERIGYIWVWLTRWLSVNSVSIELLWKHCKFHVLATYNCLCNTLILHVA